MEFRKLRADEIEVRVGTTNNGGVKLLLYKDARCDQNILDETFGPMNWQRHHTNDNKNCIVSVYDEEKKEWVEKEDAGTESNTEPEKGLASDSFKRACVNWGIGRELYTAKNLDIFIKKDKLQGYVEKNGKFYVNDRFVVSEIEYLGNVISKITIDCYYYENMEHRQTFYLKRSTTSMSQDKATQQPAAKVPEKVAEKPVQTSSKPAGNTELFADNEIILIGNCRGKTFGESKDTEMFKSFLNWVKNSTSNYKNEEQADQLRRFKELAEMQKGA